MNNFIEIKNQDVVKIAPSLLNTNYTENILKILKKKYEGVCSKFGYVKKNSISIVSVTQGLVELSTFHGYVLFDVKFTASVCNPAMGSVIECVVNKINAFGVLCTSGIMVDNVYNNILNIVIPKNNSQFMNNASIIEHVNVNDVVYVEILGKKYILNNTTINVFGKLIKGGKKSDNVENDETNNKMELEDDEIEDEILQEDDLEDNDDEKSEVNTVLSDTIEDIDNYNLENDDVSDVNSENDDEEYY